MDEQKKSKINFWLELVRIIIAAVSGLLAGGGAQTLL